MKKTGGRHDPRHLAKMIELLKEWLPDEEESRGPIDTYANGWNSYRNQIMGNLK